MTHSSYKLAGANAEALENSVDNVDAASLDDDFRLVDCDTSPIPSNSPASPHTRMAW